MENKIKNVYTAYHIDNSDSFGSFISVGEAAWKRAIAAFDLWFYVTNLADVLISQKNGFSLGVRNHELIFTHPQMPRQVWKQNGVKRLPEKIWHNLYMGYDGKEISIYVDSFPFCKIKSSFSPFTSDGFILGEAFTGYIRSFRIYDSVIAEEAYKNYCFASAYHAESTPHMTAFLDFSKDAIPNLCPGIVDVQIHEGCSPVNLVNVYCPLSGNSALLQKSMQSSGMLFTNAFSIYNKLYTRPSEQERHVIAAYGESSEDDYVEIFAKKSGKNMKFGIRLGEQEYLFRKEIGSFQWVDVITAVQGKTLTAYINGIEETISITKEFMRTRKGDFWIGGNGSLRGTGSKHYLHTTAVFQKVLGAEDAASFMENHPFIFEDHLTALVRFEDNSALEYVSGETLRIDSGDLFLAENTVDVLPDSPYQYRIAYTKEVPSEMQRWKAELYVGAHTGFMQEAFGLVSRPGKRQEMVKDVMIRYFSNHEKVLGQAAQLYTKPQITSEEVLQSMSGNEKATYYSIYQGMDCVLESAAGMLAPAVPLAGGAVASVFENLPAYIAIGLAIIMTIGAFIISLVQQLRKKKPDEEGELQLLSVCFQHSPDDHACSAVRCRNYNGVISGDEWTNEDKSVGSAVYIADQVKKVKIKIRFKITNQSAKSAGTCDVYIGAEVLGGESCLFDGFSYNKSGLMAGQEYEAVLECEREANPEQDFSCSEVELFWGGRINKTPAMLPNTKTKIYVIPTTPCSPIYLEKGCDEGFVAVEYLDILSRMQEEVRLERTERGQDMREAVWLGRPRTLQNLIDITQGLYCSRFFKYPERPDQFYDSSTFLEVERIGKDNAQSVFLITFHEGKFLSEATRQREAPLTIECNVYAAILCYYFNLFHIDARIVQMLNPLYEDEERQIYEELHFENVYPAGHQEGRGQNLDFSAHMLVEVPPQRNVEGLTKCLLFDASMGIMTNRGIQALAGYPFGRTDGSPVNRNSEADTYRGAALRNGSRAVLVFGRYAFRRKLF